MIENWILTLNWLISLNSNVMGKGTTTGGVDLFRGAIPMMVLHITDKEAICLLLATEA